MRGGGGAGLAAGAQGGQIPLPVQLPAPDANGGRPLQLRGRRQAVAWDIALAALCCSLLLWAARALLNIQLVGVDFLVNFWLAAMLLCVTGRFAIRFALRRTRRSGHQLRQLLIVGTNARAIALARMVETTPELGYHLIGFVDDKWVDDQQARSAGYKLATNFDDFQEFITHNVVDEVMVCIPVKSLYERSSEILAQCEEQGITARFVSDVFTPKLGKSHVEQIDKHVVLTIETGEMRGWAMGVKRMIDLVAASSLLLVMMPALLVTALLVKVTSPGPVFFTQERMGINKRRFRLYKFRTMVPDAERRIADLESQNEINGPVFKIRNDPRITPFGRFLRRTSLDELPQLINVVKGEMSLVGPRPLPVRDFEGFSTAWHRRRFSVKPGITCLWQVLGRNSIPFDRWMELDMQYIDEWSLSLDFHILMRTIPAVLKGSGAS